MTLLEDICKATLTDPFALSNKDSDRWKFDDSGLARLDGRIFVPESGDLRTCVLKWKHDHPTAGHPGQSKTLELVRRDFTWPKVRTDVINYVRSCTSCGHSKASRHKPYGTLQQLPIPDRKSTRLNSSHSGESRMPSSA